MPDISGHNNQTVASGDNRGYVGYTYEVTPPPSYEVMKERAKAIRIELGLESAEGQKAEEMNPTEEHLERLGDSISKASTTRVGYWF